MAKDSGNGLSLWQQANATADLAALQAAGEACAQHGLRLSQAQLLELYQGREAALQDAGRIELGPALLPRLLQTFAGSPYLQQEDLANTLQELQEIFYYFKSDCFERLSDQELLDVMRQAFDGPAQGDTAYLADSVLPPLCRQLRAGMGLSALGEAEE